MKLDKLLEVRLTKGIRPPGRNDVVEFFGIETGITKSKVDSITVHGDLVCISVFSMQQNAMRDRWTTLANCYEITPLLAEVPKAAEKKTA